MITREEVYKHVYHQKLNELENIQKRDKTWTKKLEVDKWYLSRKANIHAVQNTEAFYQAVANSGSGL